MLNKISVVIPTRNRYDNLYECVQSLLKQTVPPFEIIIVDDFSDHNLKKKLLNIKQSNTSKIRIYFNKQQYKQSRSKNIGTKLARGDIVYFIDDDCTADHRVVELLLEEFQNSEVLAVGGKIYNLGGKQSIKDALINSLLNGVSLVLGLIYRKPGSILPTGYTRAKFTLKGTYSVDWLSAGNMAIRRYALQEVGGFDYKTYQGHCEFEEADLFFRLKRFNRIFKYNSNIICHHTFSNLNRDITSKSKLFYFYRNQNLFFLKNRLYTNIINLLLFILDNVWQILLSAILSISNKNYIYVAIGRLSGIRFIIKSKMKNVQ